MELAGRRLSFTIYCRGHFQLARLQHVPPSPPNHPFNATPMFVAAQQGNTEVLKILLNATNNVGVERADHQGATPLFVAAQQGHQEVVQVLVDAGANVETTIPDGTSPIHIGSHFGRVAAVKVLVEAGAR